MLGIQLAKLHIKLKSKVALLLVTSWKFMNTHS